MNTGKYKGAKQRECWIARAKKENSFIYLLDLSRCMISKGIQMQVKPNGVNEDL